MVRAFQGTGAEIAFVYLDAVIVAAGAEKEPAVGADGEVAGMAAGAAEADIFDLAGSRVDPENG